MYQIHIQIAAENTFIPQKTLLRRWAKQALAREIETGEVTIRIVDPEEMIHLNHTYRGKPKPTNVLSFPMEMPEGVDLDIPLLGDIVICAEVVNKEAEEQHKTADAHWGHMVIHGIYHLLGYDHENDVEAEEMENLEIATLASLGFQNPYITEEDIKKHD